MDLIARLRNLLRDVRDEAGAGFSGIGVIVCNDPQDLPLWPLRPESIFPGGETTVEALAMISQVSSEFHDGFHILSPLFDVMLVAQYFSPPIILGAAPDPARLLGGRYMAAKFGSAVPGVQAAGVASSRYGVAVFERGAEVGWE